MKYILTLDELDYVLESNIESIQDTKILDKIRYFKSNTAEFKKFWDNKIDDKVNNKSTNAWDNVDLKYPNKRSIKNDTSPYVTYGLRTKTEVEINNELS